MPDPLARLLSDAAFADDLRDLVAGRHTSGDRAGSALGAADRAIVVDAVEGGGPAGPLSPAGAHRVWQFLRPVLFVRNGRLGVLPESPTWRARLEACRPVIEPALGAVGRVNLTGDPERAWNGTAWLVAPDLAFTARHVAARFAAGEGLHVSFLAAPSGEPIRASVDFFAEHANPARREVRVGEVAWLAAADAPDVALLRLDLPDGADPLGPPLRLAEVDPPADTPIAAVGYPAADSMRSDYDILRRMFDGVYNVKRLAPGRTTERTARLLSHDCSTLGGNSGSPLLDLATCRVVGLHVSGEQRVANYAVPASLLAEELDRHDRARRG